MSPARRYLSRLTGKRQASIGDHFAVNIRNFGECTASPSKLCLPFCEEWLNGKADVLIDGMPALLDSCKTVCIRHGGKIKILDCGQGVASDIGDVIICTRANRYNMSDPAKHPDNRTPPGYYQIYSPWNKARGYASALLRIFKDPLDGEAWITIRAPIRAAVSFWSLREISKIRASSGASNDSNTDGSTENATGKEQFQTSEPVECNGSRAIDKGHDYEKAVRNDLYGNTRKENFSAVVDGQRVNGQADSVTTIAGKRTAVEVKYVDNWNESIRNPNSTVGNKPWAIIEQQNMVEQASKYSEAFPGGVIYHTNSVELATHYTEVFNNAGIENVTFVITPTN